MPVIADRLDACRRGCAIHDVRKSLGWVDDEARPAMVAGGAGRARQRRRRVEALRRLRLRHPAAARPFLDLVAQRGRLFAAAGGEPRSPNFFFGGFGNNWIDHLDEKRYREYYSLPGAELNEIGGRNFLKTGLEWNAPPLRFRRVGHPGVLRHLGACRACSPIPLATNLDAGEARRVVSDLGGQIDVRFGALSALELTASFGAAIAFERGADPRHEAVRIAEGSSISSRRADRRDRAAAGGRLSGDAVADGSVRHGAAAHRRRDARLRGCGSRRFVLGERLGCGTRWCSRRRAVSRYIAPIIEESAKAALLVALIASGRVGFLADAAVQGFAIGTGFALFENIWYLQTLPHAER